MTVFIVKFSLLFHNRFDVLLHQWLLIKAMDKLRLFQAKFLLFFKKMLYAVFIIFKLLTTSTTYSQVIDINQ